MAQRQQGRAEKADKVEASVTSKDSASSTSPMERFRSLARRIIGVSREEYLEAERRYQEAKGNKS
jgi:hypothetical protein